MWKAQRQELARRQAVLRVRSRDLRARLGCEAQALEPPLALADRARSQLRWWLAHPYRLAGVALLPLIPLAYLTARRPRRLIGVSLRLWSAWRTWQTLRTFLPRRAAPGQAPWNPPAR
ncbi:MAG: YqjK family protein [Ramlibacter sp.]